MNYLKVLYVTRPRVQENHGGDTVQLLNTARSIQEAFPVKVTIAESAVPSLEGFDLVHFFNLRCPQDILTNVRRAYSLGIPAVLSTIWGSYFEFDRNVRTGLQGFVARRFTESNVEYMKVIGRILKNKAWHSGMTGYLLKGHLTSQREIVNKVDVLLPNSPTELDRVLLDMSQSEKPGRVVVNAVDRSIFASREGPVDSKYESLRGCVLCAGRIEIRKGQIDLIRASKGSPWKLVIVGSPSPNSEDYYHQCRSEAGDNVFFFERVSHEELAELYRVAEVHALPSWMETPGLSSLEAAAMNCKLLVTDRGDTRWYFGDQATYVEPGDVGSIHAGIMTALSENFDESLRDKVLSKYTWEETAIQTYDAYQLALSLRSNHSNRDRNC